MKDLQRASRNPTGWKNDAADLILPTWWTLWLVSCFLGQLYFRMYMKAESINEIKQATYVGMITEVVDILLCIVAIALITKIANDQETRVYQDDNRLYAPAK